MLVNNDYREPIKCQCPKGKIHHVQCPLYNPDVIYIIDFQEDLSPSELAAQQKIYNIYKNTIHNTPEHCGCGTAAEIAYMSHNTRCFEFKYIHERESYEILLAILKKKKVSFTGCPVSKNKRPRLQSPKLDAETNDDSEEIPVVQRSPRAKEVASILSQESPYSFPLVEDTAESVSFAALPNAQPTNPPSNPPKCPPDLVTESVKADHSFEEAEEEMPPLEDIDA